MEHPDIMYIRRVAKRMSDEELATQLEIEEESCRLIGQEYERRKERVKVLEDEKHKRERGRRCIG